jgi:ornithine cyclodeaminase/alanine dehydrogenase-like protein (mu-crystallin family)
MLILTKSEIHNILDWQEALDVIGGAFAALSAGRADVPLRTGFEMKAHNGVMLLMPGAIRDDNVAQMAVKLVSVFRDNPARGLPLIYGLVTLFEADTGRPLALFDGATVTALRTGAAGGVAARYLAAPDAEVLTVFGAGAQATTQIPAILAARPGLQEIRLVGRDPQRAQAFAADVKTTTGRKVTVFNDVASALTDAQIVSAATSSLTPVFEDTMLAPGAHVNGIGAYRADMREIPGETIARCRLVVDQRAAALHEAGDIAIPLAEGLITPENIYAELGEIVGGQRAGREGFASGEISVFKSVGNAAQDVALAHYLYQKATKLGVGREIEL